MTNRIFWECIEELLEQETAWSDWRRRLSRWHRFNTFYTHYLKVENKRATFLGCTAPCEYNCPRRIVENSPSDITAVCPQNQADPVQLKFRDILIYSLRRDEFHQALCVSLKINYSADRRIENNNTWLLGDYSGTAVYLTYRAAPSILPDTISSIYLSCQSPFILMMPTVKDITPEIQQFLDKNHSVLFSMADEMRLQPDGSFKPKRSFSACMKPCSQPCPQHYQSSILPIEAYKYLVYNEK